MPIEISDDAGEPVTVRYVDAVNLSEIMQAVEAMLARTDLAERGLIVDFSGGQLLLSRTEFAKAGDRWFGSLDTSVPVAVVLMPYAQDEQSEVIQIRNMLVGGGHRTFADAGEARDWLQKTRASA